MADGGTDRPNPMAHDAAGETLAPFQPWTDKHWTGKRWIDKHWIDNWTGTHSERPANQKGEENQGGEDAIEQTKVWPASKKTGRQSKRAS